jgi:hypothetical protein
VSSAAISTVVDDATRRASANSPSATSRAVESSASPAWGTRRAASSGTPSQTPSLAINTDSVFAVCSSSSPPLPAPVVTSIRPISVQTAVMRRNATSTVIMSMNGTRFISRSTDLGPLPPEEAFSTETPMPSRHRARPRGSAGACRREFNAETPRGEESAEENLFPSATLGAPGALAFLRSAPGNRPS